MEKILIEDKGIMDITLIDKYVLRIFEKNGWYPNRQFEYADKWIKEIEKIGYYSFDYAKRIVCELGGLTFREYAPMTYLNMVALQEKKIEQLPKMKISVEIKNKCEVAYQIAKAGFTYSFNT